VSVRVLSIDPGFTRLGWANLILEKGELSLGLTGIIGHPRTDESFNEYLDDGIAEIAEEFPVILSITTPELIFFENVPPGKLGSRSELNIAASTACKVLAFQWGIPWIGIGANTVKKELTGDGTATKAVVRNTVMELFPVLNQQHKEVKLEQKKAKEKATGIPQDLFDAVAIGVVGLKLHGQAGDEMQDESR